MNSIHIRKNRKLLVCVLLLALAAATLFLLSGQRQYLLLINENSGRTLLCLAAEEGAEFAVAFTHSVNKSPVTEYYRIDGRQIYLEALHYYTFGAGMPNGPEAGQTLRYGPDGAMIIEGYHRPQPYLRYIIGHNTAHILSWQGQEIPLSSLDAPGQQVLFSVLTLSRWQALMQGSVLR